MVVKGRITTTVNVKNILKMTDVTKLDEVNVIKFVNQE